jgi:hypothetical protein
MERNTVKEFLNGIMDHNIRENLVQAIPTVMDRSLIHLKIITIRVNSSSASHTAKENKNAKN